MQAVDRDLNYSQIASVQLTLPPVWHQIGWVRGTLATSGLVFLIGFGFVTWRWAIQRRQVVAYQRLAVQELQDARQMQMSLLPKTPPVLEGMEIAGTCVPANTVSGDFYHYISLENEMTAIVLADVTGKGMKGAMNAVLSYGVLHAEAKLALSPSQMLGALNRDLYGRFQERTNCAMCLAAINPKERRLQYANAGIPYPIVKQGGKVFELELNGMPPGRISVCQISGGGPGTTDGRCGGLFLRWHHGITISSGCG